MIPGEPPNLRFQRALLTSNTCGSPAPSSLDRKTLPSIGCTHHGKVISGDSRKTETLRRLSIGQVDVIQIQCRDLFEDTALRARVDEVGRRDGSIFLSV